MLDDVDIELTDRQIAFADGVAKDWRKAAVARNRIHTNGLICSEAKSLAINVLSARTEMAAWKYLKPIDWHYQVFDHVDDLPDLSKRIDVKGVEAIFNPTIIVPKKHNGKQPRSDWAYLLVDATDHPVYHLLGWLWGHEFLDDDHWDLTLPRPAWRGLRPYKTPAEMFDLVRAGEL